MMMTLTLISSLVQFVHISKFNIYDILITLPLKLIKQQSVHAVPFGYTLPLPSHTTA